MNLFKRVFGDREPPPTLDDSTFGRIVFLRRDACWENTTFSFWGASDVQLLVDGGPDGPTEAQRFAFAELRDSRDALLPRCLDALSTLRSKMAMPEGELVVRGLTIPSLEPSSDGQLWTLWFDCVGEDHFWFGVQSDDEWKTIYPFADD